MTDRDLSALLERASADVVERDFTHDAWAGAVAQRQHRRRVVTTAAGAIAAAAVAVTTIQLTGSTHRPSPANPTTTSPAATRLSDGTPYDQMPLEGKETELAHFDAGLPPEIRPSEVRNAELGGVGMPDGPVAVYVERAGEVYLPVLDSKGGELRRVVSLALTAVHDAGGNQASPLGPRAIGGGGHYVVFAQPGKVVRLDTQTGATVDYPVPSDVLQSVGWTADGGTLVARTESGKAWRIDPWKPGAVAVAADGSYEGLFRLDADGSGVNTLQRYRDASKVGPTVEVPGPVYELWQDTINTEERAAAGAFFDQDVTSKVIEMGNGPIYQGLVAVDAETSQARVLLAPENPDGQTGRFKGCCTVLGWADGSTVLFQTVGSHGSWVLAWNVTNGRVYEVSRIVVNPAREEIPQLALNVGWRY
jgi:hypothetical protein